MRTLLLVLVVAFFAAAGCAKKDGMQVSTTSPTTMASPVPVWVVEGDAPMGSMPARMYTISPSNLSLVANVSYDLTLNNTGHEVHDLTIEGLGVMIPDTEPGQSRNVTFTPTMVGTFPMYCMMGTPPLDHRSNGMAGNVTVTAS